MTIAEMKHHFTHRELGIQLSLIHISEPTRRS